MKIYIRLLIITALCLTLFGGLWSDTPPSAAQTATWNVDVYGNKDLTLPVLYTTTITTNINNTWGTGVPVINGVDMTPYGVPADQFSVQFRTNTFFTAGTYTFTVTVDDGARLYIDSAILINSWTTGGYRTIQQSYTFAADGNHNIQVDYFDDTGDATIIVSWALGGGPSSCTEGFTYASCPYGSSPGSSPAPSNWPPASGPTAICNDGWNSCSTNASGTCSSHTGVRNWCTQTTVSGIPWYAEFFNGLDLVAPAIFTATYPASGIDLNWGQGSPGGTVPTDNFSARFTRTLTTPTDLPQGVYTFYAKADDNFRFTIDSTVIFDKWGSYGGDVQSAAVTLLNGPHTFTYEYREQTVDAWLFLTWDPPSAQNPVVPVPAGAGPGTGTGDGTGQPTGITATINTSVLNFRSGPSMSATILAKLSRGAVYPVTGRSADGLWAQINVNGQLGWVYAQYVTFSGDFNTVPVVDGGGTAPAPAPPVQPTGIRGMVMGNLRLRSGPSTRDPKIGLMPWGTEVEIYGKDRGHDWYKVNFNGLIGWCYAPWVKIIVGSFDALPYVDGTQPVYAPPPTEGVIVQAYGNMRVRNGPGFQYPKISKVVWGTRVQVLGISSDRRWYKIKFGDLIGWSYATWYRPVQGDFSTIPVTDQ